MEASIYPRNLHMIVHVGSPHISQKACSQNAFKTDLQKVINIIKKWDKLFAKTEAKGVMREMAEEAGEDYRKGRTTEISVTKDGRLTASNTQFRA